MAASASTRSKALLAELEKAAQEYLAAKEGFAHAVVQFETAKERFLSVQKIAVDGLTELDLIKWQRNNPSVRFAGKSIGEATRAVLRFHAYDAAQRHLEGAEKEFRPEVRIDKIVQDLEGGSFDFRSATPLREVNAALINLEGVKKVRSNVYRIEDTDEVLETIRRAMEQIVAIEQVDEERIKVKTR